MCGIAGIVRQEGVSDRDQGAVRRMVSSMVHRGPDDEGFCFGSQAAIGMRRLAIIDVPGGHQPIANEDGQVTIVFNGEIYNYRQLRERLDATGRHTFKTHSDTEVLVHLYEDMGRDLLGLLEGMFAFCIVDAKRGTALLARDRFGEKPLFFSVNGQGFAFSSELPALLEAPWVSRRANLDSLRQYLESGFVRGPATAFHDIQELEPGSWIEICRGRLASGSFPLAPSRSPVFADEHEAAEALQATILQAIRRQMAADVPVGAFLSGGIDSSTVVAAMQRVHSRPVRTFTARFEHTLYDESPIARAVAAHLGTEHHEIVITNGGFVEDDLRRVVRHVGQPFSDSSAIPTYHVCRQIRESVKVCLSGDGGDEVFGGYPLFQWLLRVDDIAARVPAGLARECSRFLRYVASLPGADRWHPLRRLWRGLEVAALPPRARLAHASRLFQDDELDAVCRPELAKRATPSSPTTAPHAYQIGASRLRELMQERIEGSLRDDMLVKVDRMSMAASLEVRAPMLDAGMVNFASNLPDNWLIRAGAGKHILREAVRGWLPEIVFNHPKTGFSIPLHIFQNAAYEGACRDLLQSDRVPLVRALLDRHATDAIVARGLAQKQDTAERSVYRSSHQLWSLLNLAAWADEFKVVAA